MIVAWFLLQALLVLASVQIMGRRAWRRDASVFLLIAALLLPLYVPAGPLPRAILCSLALLTLVKVLQIARDPERWPPADRLWHAFAPFDIRDTSARERTLDRPLLKRALLHAMLALGALLGLWLLPRALPLGMMLVRMGLGALLVYSAMDAITEALRLAHGLSGVSVPPIQATPIASQSIREFWSERWNKPVSEWLGEFVFLPVSRRSNVGWGLLATFATSGLLHAWMFYTALGWIPAMMAFAFFIFQAMFVMVESFIRMRDLSPLLRRAWTLGMLGISSPLFVEPVLRVLGL
jgi:hypothetical protein